MIRSRESEEVVASSSACAGTPEFWPGVQYISGPPDPRATEVRSNGQAVALCPDLKTLFENYSRLIIGVAFRVLHDPAEAEEVAQDVFFYLCRKIGLFDPSKGSLKAWIMQITLCRALDRKSLLARRRLASVDIESLRLREKTDLETELAHKLKRKALESAVADLPAMQRRTIELFYFDGLDLKEISQRLSQPIGNVRHHFYRGLTHLRNNTLLHRFCS